MKRRKRVRRPRNFKCKSHWSNFECNVNKLCLHEFAIGDFDMKLKQAKRLHAWLGKSIKYLEQEKEK